MKGTVACVRSQCGFGHEALILFIRIVPLGCGMFCLDVLFFIVAGNIFVTFIPCIVLLGSMLLTIFLFIY